MCLPNISCTHTKCKKLIESLITWQTGMLAIKTSTYVATLDTYMYIYIYLVLDIMYIHMVCTCNNNLLAI